MCLFSSDVNPFIEQMFVQCVPMQNLEFSRLENKKKSTISELNKRYSFQEKVYSVSFPEF